MTGVDQPPTAANTAFRRHAALATRSALALAAGLLMGCQTTDPNVGEGRLVLSPTIYDHFERYRVAAPPEHPLVFVVSSDGGTASWYMGAAAHGLGGQQAYQAIQQCKARAASDCYVFAHGPNIAWRGPVYISGQDEPVHLPAENTVTAAATTSASLVSVGVGDLTLTAEVYKQYLDYLAPASREASIVFVVSEDGTTAAGYNGSRGHGRGNEHAELAIDDCEKRSGKQCYVYAYGRYVAWRGTVHVVGRDKPVRKYDNTADTSPRQSAATAPAPPSDKNDGVYVAARCGYLGDGDLRIQIRDGEIESLTREIEISEGHVDDNGVLVGVEYSTGMTSRSGTISGSLDNARFVPVGEGGPRGQRSWTDAVKPCTTRFARVEN